MSDVMKLQNLTLGITGASGAIFAIEMLKMLEADERVGKVNLVASESALRVMAEELEIGGRSGLVERILGGPSKKIQHHVDANIGANIASGSYPSHGMVVLPCSMGTLAGIAKRYGGKPDRTGRGRLFEGATTADPVRAGDAVQPDPSAKHAACFRCRRDDLSGNADAL